MSITSVTARVRVDDLTAAVPVYEQLAGVAARRFEFGGARLAAVGPFLLIAATGEVAERLMTVRATLGTDDLDTQPQLVDSVGGEVISPPTATPNGRRAIVRHPDGAVFEYVGR